MITDSNGKLKRSYRKWQSMVRRCTDPKHPSFKYYGGRGIRVCNRWLEYENFESDMGEPPDGMTLERKENNGHYEPGNCVWATWSDQFKNRRKTGPNAKNGFVPAKPLSDPAVRHTDNRMRLKRGFAYVGDSVQVVRLTPGLR